MPYQFPRRTFLQGSGAALAAGMLGSLGCKPPAQEPQPTAPSAMELAEPLFEISLAEWSLHRALRGQAGEPLDHLDFARAAREDYGLNAVEYVNQFFADIG